MFFGNVETSYGNGRVTCIATKAFAKEELDESIQEVCTSCRRRSFITPGRRGLRCPRRFLRCYPYRATFDFECYFNDEGLPPDSDRVRWSARHVPLSVSEASNVPGHEDGQCYVTNGESNKCVEYMMAHLITISDVAYESLLTSYKDVLDCLKERGIVRNEVAAISHNEYQNEEKRVNPYKTLDKLL